MWKEFQECKTDEARFVKDVDKLEMALQALEYETGGNYTTNGLHHYYANARDKMKDTELLKILDKIESMRPRK